MFPVGQFYNQKMNLFFSILLLDITNIELLFQIDKMPAAKFILNEID